MPIEIKVTPPGLTMSQGRTFMVTAANGEINPHSAQGVYLMDTRFVSSYLARERWPFAVGGDQYERQGRDRSGRDDFGYG